MDITQKIQRLKDFMKKNLLFHFYVEVHGGARALSKNIASVYYTPVTQKDWGYKFDVYDNCFFVEVGSWRGFATVEPDTIKLIDLIREEFGDYEGDSFKIMLD